MSLDAEEVLDKVDDSSESGQELVRGAAELFHEREGEFFERSEAQQLLEDELQVSEEKANRLVSMLVGDQVDPVIQINTDEGKYVGIVEYSEFENSYGYIGHDDIVGKIKKIVCARCVEKAEEDSKATYYTEEWREKPADFSNLKKKINRHCNEKHELPVKKIKTGATLASGTTIAGNISWHAGNDGSGSGLNADKLDGKDASEIGHSDTSSQGDVTTGGATIIDDINLDGYGHVTNMNTQNRRVTDWDNANGTLTLDRGGIQSSKDWIEIDGNGDGILMNYKNQGEVTRFYGSYVDASRSNKFAIPQRSSDPSASAGDMWYRTDLD